MKSEKFYKIKTFKTKMQIIYYKFRAFEFWGHQKSLKKKSQHFPIILLFRNSIRKKPKAKLTKKIGASATNISSCHASK